MDRIFRSTCRLCYNSCGVLIHVKNGKPTNVEGDPSHPISKGMLCEKGLASLDYLTSPHRLKHPLKRIGEKGKGDWQKISWDEALERVSDGLKGAEQRYGVSSIIFFRGASKGVIDDYFARLANIIGTPNISSPAPVCFQPGVKASQLTYGYYAYPDFEYPPKSIVIWGSNPAETLLPAYQEILNAAKGKSKLIVVDPIENEISKKADVWIRPRPGTDLAVALGMMNVIIGEDLYDRAFIDDWTVGFEELRSHVQNFDLGEIEKISWVPKEKIVEAARLYAINRPGCIQWGNGIETTINSFQTCRALAMLRAVAGNLGIPGGEVKCSDPGGLVRGSPDFLLQDNIPQEVRDNRLSKKDNLMPIVYYALPQRIVKAILYGDPYPIRAGFLMGGNMLTSYTNADRTYEALKKLDFLSVSDLFMTPTAMLADIVLPAASYLEFDSVEQPWHIPIASVQQKVAEVGESWPDGMILNELAKKMGFKEYVWDNMEIPLNQILKPAGITFSEFRKIGALMGTKLYRHYEKTGFETPSGKVELYSKTLKDWGFDPLPKYYEPPETPFSDPQLAKEYPLLMTSRKAGVYRHSGGRQISSLRKERPDPTVNVHPETANKLGIKDGDWVRVATKRGSIRQKANFVDGIDPRVIEVDYAWWFPEKGPEEMFRWRESNLNILTDIEPPYNREMGSTNMRGISCKIYKE